MIVMFKCNECGGERHTDSHFDPKCIFCGASPIVLRERSTYKEIGGGLVEASIEKYDKNGKLVSSIKGALKKSKSKSKKKDDWKDPIETVKTDIERVAA